MNMEQELFDDLIQSLKEAKAIIKGGKGKNGLITKRIC
jgi:hypothetical protein